MRFAVVIVLLVVAVLATGCTANDRDYVRNHIVFLQPNPPPAPPETVSAGTGGPVPPESPSPSAFPAQ